MKKTLAAVLLCTAASTFALAGCPGHAEKSASGCSTHMQAASDGFALLQKDLAVLKGGVPAADKAAFFKTHAENLNKLLSARTECEKTCGAHRAEKAKTCPHMEPMAAALKLLADDLGVFQKGLDPASEKAFLEAHAQHLQKALDLREDCMKTCHAKGASADKS